MIIVHKPKTAIGKKKFEIAEALNTITDLQNTHKIKNLLQNNVISYSIRPCEQFVISSILI